MYYPIWDLLNDEEQDEARLQMQTNLTATRGRSSVTETDSLDAAYICAEKMNAKHEHFAHPAFHSHQLGYVLCSVWPATRNREMKHESWLETRVQGWANSLARRGRPWKELEYVAKKATPELLPCVCVMSGNKPNVPMAFVFDALANINNHVL